MKEIGKKLADKRRLLKLSYKDVSDMTKLPITHIKAIEQGDLDYFKDDLTYVRFYVRSYCKAVDVPYENFKDDVMGSVEEYSTTMAMKVVDEHVAIDQSISDRTSPMKTENKPQFAQKDRSSIMQNVKNTSRFRKKKIDVPFLSLLIVIILVVGILLYVGIGSLLNNKSDDAPKDDQIQDVSPTPEKPSTDTDKDQEEDKTNKVQVALAPNSTYQYQVNGIKATDTFTLEITFKAAGSFNLWHENNGVSGAYGVYQAGQTYTLEAPVKVNGKYTCNFWNYAGATIKINGEILDLDATTGLKQNDVTFVEFIFSGE